MGGAAFLVQGEISPERLNPVALPRNLLDKLLMRQRHRSPRRYVGELDVTDVRCPELDPLKGKFREFLGQQLPNPSDATEAFLEYLGLKVMTIYVRKEQSRKGNGERAYVQFSFCGCAGMAEISAEVACHWTNQWYSKEKVSIARDYFSPFGFLALKIQPAQVWRPFLPVAKIGYAAYSNGEFELDAGAYEMENCEEFLQELRKNFTGLMQDGRCRCQMCAPEFKPVIMRIA